MKEQICRLCLRTSTDNFPTLEDDVKVVFDDLFSKSVLKIPQPQNIVCNECLDNLQKFYNFKQSYVDTLDKTSQVNDCGRDASLDLKEIGNKHIVEFVHDIENPMTCSYCTKINPKQYFIYLNDLKKNTRVVNMLEKHIPKLNLNNTEYITSCESCNQLLQDVISFITNCFDVEEKIGKYIEKLDDTGQIDLKKVQAFIYKPALQENEFYNAMENEDTPAGNIKPEPVLECKPKIDLDSVIETEEIDLKSEQDVTEGFNENISTHKDPPEKITVKCKVCTFQTVCRSSMRRHMLTHRDPSEKPWHECEVCTYQTKYKKYLKYHMLTHKDPSEKEKFKCKECAFETFRKCYLNRHMKTHKDPSEMTKHKRKFEPKSKDRLKRHMLTHKNLSEVALYKCNDCSFQTMYKPYLKTHSLIHRDPLHVTWHKCEECEFETKHKTSLKTHLLTHKDPSERKWYKCEDCTFETVALNSLRRHKAKKNHGNANAQM